MTSSKHVDVTALGKLCQGVSACCLEQMKARRGGKRVSLDQ
jgi:hypothetical protein